MVHDREGVNTDINRKSYILDVNIDDLEWPLINSNVLGSIFT